MREESLSCSSSTQNSQKFDLLQLFDLLCTSVEFGRDHHPSQKWIEAAPASCFRICEFWAFFPSTAGLNWAETLHFLEAGFIATLERWLAIFCIFFILFYLNLLRFLVLVLVQGGSMRKMMSTDLSYWWSLVTLVAFFHGMLPREAKDAVSKWLQVLRSYLDPYIHYEIPEFENSSSNELYKSVQLHINATDMCKSANRVVLTRVRNSTLTSSNLAGK